MNPPGLGPAIYIFFFIGAAAGEAAGTGMYSLPACAALRLWALS